MPTTSYTAAPHTKLCICEIFSASNAVWFKQYQKDCVDLNLHSLVLNYNFMGSAELSS